MLRPLATAALLLAALPACKGSSNGGSNSSTTSTGSTAATHSAASTSSSGHSSSTSHSASTSSGSASTTHSSASSTASSAASTSTASTSTGSTSTGSSGSSGTGWQPLPPTAAAPQLWYLHRSYLSVGNPSEPAFSESLIDQAVDAGYTGLALDDDSITRLNYPGFDPSVLTTVLQYAESRGLKVLPSTDPYGYSNDMLKENPNLAEGMAVVGTQYTVAAGANGNVLSPINSLSPLQNGDFESGETGWFSFGDARVGLDTTASDCHSGSACGMISGDASATNNARFTETLTLTPWRLYHVQFWLRTQNLSGNDLTVEVLDNSQSTTLTLLNQPISGDAQMTSWTQVDLSFNSRTSTAVTLYLGIWGGNQGNVWIDDVVGEETGLVNVVRRAGTPVRVYDSSGATYVEGTDYATIVDPSLNPTPGNFDVWHTPPTVSIPAGSSLTLGATVSIDYNTIIPLGGSDLDQVGICLSDPGVQSWVLANITAMNTVFPAGSGIFLGYDEMRQMNSCDLCRSLNLTAGQLLAQNVSQTWTTVQGVMPGAVGYVWSDMFDPFHNATAAYQDEYPVEGDITGSWLGLQPGFIIMNWNLGNLGSSLPWFAGTQSGSPHAFQQIIAGYYDSGDGNGSATSELQSAMGVPGLVGLMYTTWESDYSQMGAFATAVRSGWPAYQASTPP